MYESYYGFSGKPFQLNPDPSFYFASRQHKRAMAFVEYGLHQGEGFIVVTGEVGAGKTTVVRNLLSKLDRGRVIAASLVSTQLEADDTLRMVAAAFGVNSRDLPKADLLLGLEACLAAHARDGRRCLLIVDEAQNLPSRAVEELRMLSNFQLGNHALLQTFLVGQPEFRRIIRSPQFHQLRQRVIAASHIGPLESDDTRSYIEHRFGRVGWKGAPTIAPQAFDAVFEASGGIPRRINLLLDRLLLAGFLRNTQEITAEMVRDIASEIDQETLEPADLGSRKSEDADLKALEIFPGADAGASADHVARTVAIDRDMREIRLTLDRIEKENRVAFGALQRFFSFFRPGEREAPKDK